MPRKYCFIHSTSRIFVFTRQNQTLGRKGQADHCRDGNVRPPRLVKTQQGDDIFDRAQGQSAKECADDVADAAGGGGRNGVHFRADRVRRRTRAEVQEVDEAADAADAREYAAHW